MIAIQPLNDQEVLANFLRTQLLQPFLQSWAWGDFQSQVGRKIWRLGAWNGSKLVGVALVIEHQLVFGKTYLYCPRGPLADSVETLQALLDAMKKLGQESKAMYIKADLTKYTFPVDPKMFTGWSVGTTLQPRQTLLIDVSRFPSDLLGSMHQKTRYNIRLAEKRGVTVRWSTSEEDFKTFLQLMHQTYARQGIRLHSDAYYQLLFKTLLPFKMCDVGLAEYQGEVLAANLMIWHDQTVTYLHGGSSEMHKDVMAPHILQWRTIERAHTAGMTKYDLWGIAPLDQPQHKWSGVTRFKKGLGGQVEVFPPALNAILQPQWYWTYRLAKRMRGGVDE